MAMAMASKGPGAGLKGEEVKHGRMLFAASLRTELAVPTSQPVSQCSLWAVTNNTVQDLGRYRHR